MKEYKVHITETHIISVNVKALNAEEARKIVEQMYMENDFIHGADHFKGVTFSVPGYPEQER
ncbi:MAG: DpnD/PcfM family protein [Syntrophomonadaceae bacterium]|jgi:hypothetical protein|nr:DpnD/PcfM family protein [Syntrophomonadaceae bacterium]